MYSDKLPGKQLQMWLLSAQSALLIVGAGKTVWSAVALSGVAGWLLTAVVLRVPSDRLGSSKALWGLEWLWAAVVMAMILRNTGDCWQTSQGETEVIPLTLLALAVWSAMDGAGRPARIGSILAWLLGVIYIVILAAGLGGIRYVRVRSQPELPQEMLLIGFLLPCSAVFLPRRERQRSWYYIVSVAFALAVSILTAGTLSQTVASTEKNGFYEAVRGMSLFGAAERFESFLSAAMTLGWFSALSLLASVAGEAAGRMGIARSEYTVPAAAALAALLYRIGDMSVEGIGVIGCLLFWCLLPLAASFAAKRKKSKKPKKGG